MKELKCSIQNYEWGKRGMDSMVATLVHSNTDVVIEENIPYAELWMGTHTNGPSMIRDCNITLESYIKDNVNVIGDSVRDRFGEKLPFLFKVLSVQKALSIQVHPNKTQAEKLHKNQPLVYKDPNHKPELAVALTPFEALCGFRPISEIQHYLKTISELADTIGETKVGHLNSCEEADQKIALKKCFTSLMTREPEIVAEQLKKLLSRMSAADNVTREKLNASLFEQLYSDYPGDVGCFGIYLFNYVRLEPGEAIFLGPNEPHAYLYGDCIECMACSDNVVRAGLTPKMKDVETLVNMLSYNCDRARSKLFQSHKEDNMTEIFKPPVPDFAVAKITIPPGISTYDLIVRNSASILIVVNGKAELLDGTTLLNGSVIFIEAKEKLSLKVICGCHPMLMFQAMANVF